MKPVMRLCSKVILLLLPLVAIFASYVVLDPFMVIYHYDGFYHDGPRVPLNRDYISTETLLTQISRRPYDSFIFGSSRSLVFLCADWTPYIGSQLAFHYDASTESLFGISRKIQFLHDRRIPIHNALLILDVSCLRRDDDSDGHLFIKHPLLSGKSEWQFHSTFLRAYFSHGFFLRYPFGLFCSKDSTCLPRIFERQVFQIDGVSNDVIFAGMESEIAEQGENYYVIRANQFYQRIPATSSPVLGKSHLALLRAMKETFEAESTRYRLVISPLYDQQRIHPEDLKILVSLFGQENVFDFSGANEFTSDIHNYYEASHYRLSVGREIFRRIYTQPTGRSETVKEGRSQKNGMEGT